MIYKNDLHIPYETKINDFPCLKFRSLEDTGLVRHLFTTREGGVSSGIYESMNLSYARGDKNETDFKVGEVEGEIIGEPYIPLDIEPEFPGGQESLIAYLQRNIRYPQKAREQHITGKVFVTFVIEKDGRVSHVRILRDIGGGCGQEAVRVVEAMPKWKAGMRQGESVPAQFNLPVQFSLENEAE